MHQYLFLAFNTTNAIQQSIITSVTSLHLSHFVPDSTLVALAITDGYSAQTPSKYFSP